jgi:uncharacterized sulfatase
MPKIVDRFQPYLILGSVYLAANIMLRCIDLFLLSPLFNVPVSAPVFLKCILNDIIWCGCVFLTFIPVYYILHPRFQNISLVVPSLVFGTLFLIQILLVIYAFFSGKLLDKEIFVRPFSEIYTTINSYGNIFLFGLFGIALIISFSWISTSMAKKTGHFFRIVSFTSSIILLLSVFMVSYPYKLYGWNTQDNRFIINRALFFIYEDLNYSHKDLNAEYADPAGLQQFTSEYPQWQISDSLYPFLRNDNTPDVLSPFFNLNSEKPDIVYIVMESLGRGISGENAWSGSFTPFLDSLANHGLYWENCVTTAQRSFGILPALLGSLPNGNTGFQLGVMPAHSTIVRLLKDNGYKTNMFYAGYYEFDNLKAFMNMQGTDFYAPYYDEYKTSGFREEKANDWGYADELLFNRSVDYLDTQGDKDHFSLYVTLTAHNDINIPGKEKYINAAKSINNELIQKKQKRNNTQIDYIASFVYADDALRRFFNRYRERPDFNNTIFVITGDHYISNFGIPGRLSLYHVPLLVYSPMLKTSQRFKSMVSVLDITPSVWSMLRNNYDLIKPQHVSWLGDGLDTARNFRNSKKILLMQDNRDSREFIYNNYFYSYDSIYKIDENLRLLPAPQSVYAEVSKKYNLFNMVERYVYNKGRLMPGY